MRHSVHVTVSSCLMPDGKTVSPAINAQKLTGTKDELKAAINGLQLKKGFANIAQAFSMAEDMSSKEPESRLNSPSC